VAAQIAARQLGPGTRKRVNGDHRLTDGTIVLSLELPEIVAPSVTRAIVGRTRRDIEIDELTLPLNPLWLRLSIGALRLYRTLRPEVIGRRCVWDPSCSRYSEAAFRKRGFFGGCVATFARLLRCRPGRGGVDLA
jgi:uncharacterized protein